MINALALAGWLTQMFGTLALSSPEAGISKVFKGYLNSDASRGVTISLEKTMEMHARDGNNKFYISWRRSPSGMMSW